jgi:hypothetical protein
VFVAAETFSQSPTIATESLSSIDGEGSTHIDTLRHKDNVINLLIFFKHREKEAKISASIFTITTV